MSGSGIVDAATADTGSHTVMGSTLWRGVGETLAVVAAFVVFGLGWLAAERAMGAGPAYPPPAMNASDADPDVWLIDGFNVLHAGPLGGRDRAGWWTEARRDEVLALARRFDDPGAEIWVVFDGGDPRGGGLDPARPVHRVFAPCADDWLLARVRAAAQPGAVAVVTGDRRLAARARHRGARVFAPRAFLDRCTG